MIGILFPIFFLLVKFNCLKDLVILFFTHCATQNDSQKKNFVLVCLQFVKSIFFFFWKTRRTRKIQGIWDKMHKYKDGYCFKKQVEDR